jgi:hypothetical protein
MKFLKYVSGLFFGLATFGIIAPLPLVSAAMTNTPVRASRDVTLAQGGVLHGQLLGDAGNAISDEIVALFINGKEVARSKTDRNGRFGFRNLRGGVVTLVTRHGAQSLRAWRHNTAPPIATRGVLLTTDTLTLRANEGMSILGNGGLGGLLVLGGIAAIVVIAVDDDGS